MKARDDSHQIVAGVATGNAAHALDDADLEGSSNLVGNVSVSMINAPKITLLLIS